MLDTIYIPCVTLIGDRTDTLINKIRSYIQESRWHYPSLLIFDDLDQLLPPEQNDAGVDTAQMMPDWNVRVLRSVIHELLEETHAIVTGRSVSNVIDREGIIISLDLPDKMERIDILSHALKDSGVSVPKTLLQQLSIRTDAFSPTDICNFVQRALHLHFLKSEEQPGLKAFEQALDGFKTQVTQGVKLYEPPKQDIRWEDVGGLVDVKRVLRETLEFPIMYSSLFQKAPINLRSGLLLYGYPGCGKTHIINCMANVISDKVKFLMVKGPELLNKYIGASEQAVRDVFQRAKSIAPCVIFFDEFDALAQQRGTSDQGTGVTDRVVNQLLCELDGVEGRGDPGRMVYVVAATSRPDMIDVALLRPGRLDKSLLCSMPDQDERKQIILAHFKGIELDDAENDSVFDLIAKETSYFTGADLQALIYTATLLSAHNKIDHSKKETANEPTNQENLHIVQEGKGLDAAKLQVIHQQTINIIQNESQVFEKQIQQQTDNASVKIHSKYLLQALTESRPSLGVSERKRLEKIYQYFANEELTKQELMNNVPNKKVTLA
jgi:peroxin-1